MNEIHVYRVSGGKNLFPLSKSGSSRVGCILLKCFYNLYFQTDFFLHRVHFSKKIKNGNFFDDFVGLHEIVTKYRQLLYIE